MLRSPAHISQPLTIFSLLRLSEIPLVVLLQLSFVIFYFLIHVRTWRQLATQPRGITKIRGPRPAHGATTQPQSASPIDYKNFTISIYREAIEGSNTILPPFWSPSHRTPSFGGPEQTLFHVTGHPDKSRSWISRGRNESIRTGQKVCSFSK